MLYCTYESYAQLGGQMSREAYALWGPRASRKIDGLTMGRAERKAAELAEELASACAQMADAMATQAEVEASRAGGLRLSASNDGYSESYAAGTVSGDGQLLAILADALAPDPLNLLYRGCGACCWAT